MTKHLIVLLVLLKAVSAFAVATPKPLPTSFVQKITFNLTVATPGKTTTSGNTSITTVSNFPLTTRFVLESLGEVTSNDFSAKAQIVCVNPIGYLTNMTRIGSKTVTNIYGYLNVPVSFQIRDGAKVVDVTQYFSVGNVPQAYIASATQPNLFAYTAYKNYRIRTITVANQALGFVGQGFVESPLVTVPVGGGAVVFGNNDDWTSFSGVASNGAVNGILQGTVSATYEKVE